MLRDVLQQAEIWIQAHTVQAASSQCWASPLTVDSGWSHYIVFECSSALLLCDNALCNIRSNIPAGLSFIFGHIDVSNLSHMYACKLSYFIYQDTRSIECAVQVEGW